MLLNLHALLLTALLPKHDRSFESPLPVSHCRLPLLDSDSSTPLLDTQPLASTLRVAIEQLIELRYSTGYRSSPWPLSPLFLIESALRNSLSSPGNCASNASLISSTSLFRLVRIVR